MDPIIVSIVAAVGALAYIGVKTIYVAWLTFSKIGEIFRRLKKRTRVTKRDIGFITQSVRSGKCSEVSGIFDTKTGKIKEKVQLQVDAVSPEVEKELSKTGTILLT